MSPCCNLSCQCQRDPEAQQSSASKPRADNFSSNMSFCPAQASPAKRRRVGQRGNTCTALPLPTQPIPVSSWGGKATSQAGPMELWRPLEILNPEQPGTKLKVAWKGSEDPQGRSSSPKSSFPPLALLCSAAEAQRMKLSAIQRQGWLVCKAQRPQFFPHKGGWQTTMVCHRGHPPSPQLWRLSGHSTVSPHPGPVCHPEGWKRLPKRMLHQ